MRRRNNMTMTIYAKWLALELRKKGFPIIETGINENFPQYDTYIFEETKELKDAITTITNSRK